LIDAFIGSSQVKVIYDGKDFRIYKIL